MKAPAVVLVITYRDRPWWGLGLYQREREMACYPPPNASLEDVREMQALALDRDWCVSARIEDAA